MQRRSTQLFFNARNSRSLSTTPFLFNRSSRNVYNSFFNKIETLQHHQKQESAIQRTTTTTTTQQARHFQKNIVKLNRQNQGVRVVHLNNTRDGGSRFNKSTLIIFAVMGIGGLIVIATSLDKAPVTGRYRLIFWSAQAEQLFGASLFKQFKQRALPPNHKYSVLVNDIGTQIQSVLGAQASQHWEFIVVDDKSINAFCLPGTCHFYIIQTPST